MDPTIKDKICKPFHLPPDLELIKETELIFLQFEHENPLKEQMDIIRKLEITNKPIQFYIQVVSTIKTAQSIMGSIEILSGSLL